MFGGNNETQKNDANMVMKETEAVDETKIEKEWEDEIEEEVKTEAGIRADAQASMNTETKVVILKIPVQVEDLSNENETTESLKCNCRKSLGFDWYDLLGKH